MISRLRVAARATYDAYYPKPRRNRRQRSGSTKEDVPGGWQADDVNDGAVPSAPHLLLKLRNKTAIQP